LFLICVTGLVPRFACGWLDDSLCDLLLYQQYSVWVICVVHCDVWLKRIFCAELVLYRTFNSRNVNCCCLFRLCVW